MYYYRLVELGVMQEEPQDQQSSVKRLLPKPLELLPQRDDLLPPQFAVQGLMPLHTDGHFKPLEEIFEMNSTQSTITVRAEHTLDEMFRQTIYQKYRERANRRVIRCRMFKANEQRPCIANGLLLGDQSEAGYRDVRFESKFESGNLGRVSRVNRCSPTEFNLLIDNDINTSGFTQWFFFKVEVDKACKLRFNILNFRKRSSLFQRGMKVCVYSRRRNQQSGEGWMRAGTEIIYHRSQLDDNGKVYYTLSFSYESKFARDDLLFSYHYPYTYSDLQRFYQWLMGIQCAKRNLMCLTPCRNKLHCLTITENGANWKPMTKRYVFILARAHPGETIGSLLVERLVRYLVSNEKLAMQLRHMYIFKIIPMINPDGVLHGNSRCSLPGRDLNRSWEQPDPYLFPQVYHIKKMILDVHRNNQIEMVCDLHGHSLKKDAFIYGCHKKNHPFATRQFPWVLSRLCKNFNYSQCAFANSSVSKFGTARVSLFRALKIANVFTLQTSFCGPSRSVFHWSEDDLKDLMKCFCQALHTLGRKPKLVQPAKFSVDQVSSETTPIENVERERQQLLNELYRSKQNYECGLHQQESDSDVQQDYIEQDLFCPQSVPNSPKKQECRLDAYESPTQKSKSFVMGRQRRKSEENSLELVHQRLVKGKTTAKKQSLKPTQCQRIEQFDNIKFWVGSEKLSKSPAHNQSSSQKRNMMRRGYHSRTETNHPEQQCPRPRDIEFDMLRINLPVPKTPQKIKRVATESINQSQVIRRRNSKDVSVLSILPEKLQRVSKKYSPIVYNPQQRRYNRIESRTEQLRKHEPGPQTNFVNSQQQHDRKVFERQLIDQIDKRLQNYIEVYKLNRYSEGIVLQPPS